MSKQPTLTTTIEFNDDNGSYRAYTFSGTLTKDQCINRLRGMPGSSLIRSENVISVSHSQLTTEL